MQVPITLPQQAIEHGITMYLRDVLGITKGEVESMEFSNRRTGENVGTNADIILLVETGPALTTPATPVPKKPVETPAAAPAKKAVSSRRKPVAAPVQEPALVPVEEAVVHEETVQGHGPDEGIEEDNSYEELQKAQAEVAAAQVTESSPPGAARPAGAKALFNKETA